MAVAFSTDDRDRGPAGEALLDHAVMGGGLPAEADAHLLAASRSYDRDAVAESYLRKAEALAPDHAAVLIGFYRFYFYKGRLADALDIARRCLAKAARECNFATDWRAVRPQDAAFGSLDALWPRFFMFTLKGYAYLQVRLGALGEGREAACKLLELDPADKIGARLLLDILDSAEAAADA